MSTAVVMQQKSRYGDIGSGNVGGFVYVGVNDPVEKEKWTIQD